MIHAEKKAIANSIDLPKNDIGKRRKEDKNTVMRKDNDDGDFGNKVRERKTNSIEKKKANL